MRRIASKMSATHTHLLNRVPFARSAGFQTCCVADFQVGRPFDLSRACGLETRDTADWKSALRPAAFASVGNIPSKSSMKRLLAILLLATITACPVHAKLNLVVTTPDLASIAEAIGGAGVSVTTLTRPTEDPHFVDAKPSFVLKLNRADAVLEGGADLEVGWLPALLEQSRNNKLASGAPGRLRGNTGVAMLEVPTTLDRSMGDVHAAGNPHFMMDPANARLLAAYLAASFCQLDAASCETYRANLKKFTAELDAKMVEWQKRLAPFAGQHIVAYHNSWPYFGKRFSLNIDLFLEPKPGIPPSPTHLAGVIRKMKQDDVRVVFVEPYLSRRTAEKVAEETGATVVDVTQFPGALKGTAGYLQLMDYLVNAVAAALEKKK